MALDMRVEGTKLIIEVGLDSMGKPSASGKSMVVATTHGFVHVEDSDVRANITIIR